MARDGAQDADRRNQAPRGEEGTLVIRQRRVTARERHVAAENRSALASHAVGQRMRQRRDGGDRPDAKEDAGDENAKAAYAAAQIPQCKPQQKRHAHAIASRA